MSSLVSKNHTGEHRLYAQVLSGPAFVWADFAASPQSKIRGGDFPGRPGVKRPPVNAGGMVLIPGLGRPHMSRSN